MTKFDYEKLGLNFLWGFCIGMGTLLMAGLENPYIAVWAGVAQGLIYLANALGLLLGDGKRGQIGSFLNAVAVL